MSLKQLMSPIARPVIARNVLIVCNSLLSVFLHTVYRCVSVHTFVCECMCICVNSRGVYLPVYLPVCICVYFCVCICGQS